MAPTHERSLTLKRNTLIESFYSVNMIVNYYVKCLSDNLSNENKNWCFHRSDISKIVYLGILIHVLSWNIYFRLLRKTWSKMPKWSTFEVSFLWKHQCFCFHYWDYLTNNWRNKWRSIFDGVEGLNLSVSWSPPRLKIVSQTKNVWYMIILFKYFKIYLKQIR